MGLERTIRFPGDETPPWSAIRTHLARVGEDGQLRMIDGLPAFPDETPPEDWNELRVGTPAGMVTVRRGSGVLSCVVWGNADPVLNLAWSKVIWACAAAGGGIVQDPSGALQASDFAARAGISPA
jgi:hypothetical protein